MLIEKRFQAQKLRKSGYSMKEIAAKLGVAKSSVSLWVRDTPLSEKAKTRLLTRITAGQLAGAESKRAHSRLLEKQVLKKARILLKSLPVSRGYNKVLCAAIYWCEGAKDMSHGVTFMNSDPDLMSKFLELFRESFPIDEKKFRPLLHLHAYHDVAEQIDFWSKVTRINKEQFSKPYIKPNGGKKIRENYRGCLSLRYFSNVIARELLGLGKAYLNKGGIG